LAFFDALASERLRDADEDARFVLATIFSHYGGYQSPASFVHGVPRDWREQQRLRPRVDHQLTLMA